jgi:hypothetical protein
MRIRVLTWLLPLGLLAAALPAYKLAIDSPILAATPGEWDCACGDWYIMTSRTVLWNPFRDRAPEQAAEFFLARLRNNTCTADPGLCAAALATRRVSAWKLGYREDSEAHVTLYYRLTKFGSPVGDDLSGQGAITVSRQGSGWAVTGYDAFF